MEKRELEQFGNPESSELILATLQYGHSDWTIKMLDSVASKNGRIQRVVLDQGSGAEDWERTLNYQRSHDDLTILRSPVNLGIPMGWNTIVKFCLNHSDRVLVAPNDILYRHDTIDVLMDAWENKPYDNVVSVSSVWMGSRRNHKFGEFEDGEFEPGFQWSWTGFNGLITPDFIKKVGWYDEDLGPWWWDDTDLLLRIFKSGNLGMVVNHSKVWLTEHSTKEESIPKEKLSHVYRRNMLRFAEKHGLDVDKIHEQKHWQYHYLIEAGGRVVEKKAKGLGCEKI